VIEFGPHQSQLGADKSPRDSIALLVSVMLWPHVPISSSDVAKLSDFRV